MCFFLRKLQDICIACCTNCWAWRKITLNFLWRNFCCGRTARMWKGRKDGPDSPPIFETFVEKSSTKCIWLKIILLASFSFPLMNFYLLVEIIDNLPGLKIFLVHSNRFLLVRFFSPRSSWFPRLKLTIGFSRLSFSFFLYLRNDEYVLLRL